MRYKLIIEYNGEPYCGFQYQVGLPTIQGELERALYELLGEHITVVGSGRTDAGVHALGQVVHFDADTSIPTNKLHYAINTRLPRSIMVLSAEEVASDFHARYDATSKTYMYRMYMSEFLRPTKMGRLTHVGSKLDVTSMQIACQYFMGEHDFSCFSNKSEVTNTVRTIYAIDLTCEGEELTLMITGNGFLYNMVRIIAGTLVNIGLGKLQANDIENIFASCDRAKAGKTLAPDGLYLVEVRYN